MVLAGSGPLHFYSSAGSSVCWGAGHIRQPVWDVQVLHLFQCSLHLLPLLMLPWASDIYSPCWPLNWHNGSPAELSSQSPSCWENHFFLDSHVLTLGAVHSASPLAVLVFRQREKLGSNIGILPEVVTWVLIPWSFPTDNTDNRHRGNSLWKSWLEPSRGYGCCPVHRLCRHLGCLHLSVRILR